MAAATRAASEKSGSAGGLDTLISTVLGGLVGASSHMQSLLHPWRCLHLQFLNSLP